VWRSLSDLATKNQFIKARSFASASTLPLRYGSGRSCVFVNRKWVHSLKTEEQLRLSAEWDLQRTLAKINYRIHTDAIKEQIIPPEVTKEQAGAIYASEADLLNVALFGKTAAEWRAVNPGAKGNIRDEATLEQLIVLSNMESINALLIRQGLTQSERLIQLNQTAITQLTSLLANEHIKRLGEGEVKI